VSPARIAAFVAGLGVAAGLLAFPLATPSPPLSGEDQIRYVTLRPLTLTPGVRFSSPVEVQNPGLTSVQFHYALDAPRAARVDVTWARMDGTPFDRETIVLEPTPRFDALLGWLAVDAWGPVVYYATVPVRRPPPTRFLLLTLELEMGSPAPVLYVNSPIPPDPRPAGLAVRTRYGEPAPLIALLPTIMGRMATIAPPWLRGPAPWALVLLALVLGVAAAAAVVFVEEA
jgi:hypothetical protein